MFLNFINEFLTNLISADVAAIFTAPIAFLIACLLIFGIFTFFIKSSHKKILLILICVVVGAFAIFSLAQFYGFVEMPVILGGSS